MDGGDHSMTNDQKESPLQRPPLRQAGQSLQEERDDILNEKIEPVLLTGLFLIVLAVYEWFGWFFKTLHRPWVVTVIAVGYVLYAAIRVRPFYRLSRQLRLGRDGERIVGQELEKLRTYGYRVYHDFLADDFNIDHIVVGPTGIFTVETKAFRKPKDPDAKIGYDGHVVSVPGVTLTRDPIAQARAESDYVRDWVKDNANRTVPVRAALVFVGWYTQKQPEGAEVWVLNVPGLLSFIQNEHSELSQDDIAHVCGILEAHIIQKQKQLSGGSKYTTWSQE